MIGWDGIFINILMKYAMSIKKFKNDLKLRIDETAKYIRPQEKTTDFAFMFIPSEGIYYDLLVNQVGAVKVNTRDLIEYAFKDKKVIIVSPTSFYAYLQTVIQGFKKMQIEEQTKEIIKRVEMLGDQYDRVALVLVRAIGPRRHDLAGLEAFRDAEIEQFRHECAVTHHVAFKPVTAYRGKRIAV